MADRALVEEAKERRVVAHCSLLAEEPGEEALLLFRFGAGRGAEARAKFPDGRGALREVAGEPGHQRGFEVRAELAPLGYLVEWSRRLGQQLLEEFPGRLARKRQFTGQEIEFLQPGGSTSSRAAATAVELQFAL